MNAGSKLGKIGVQSRRCCVKWRHAQLLSNIEPKHVKFKYLNDNKCSKNHPGKFSQVPSHQSNEIVELMKKETYHYKNQLKAGFHWRRILIRSRNQKRRTLRSGENSVLIRLIPLTTPSFTIK